MAGSTNGATNGAEPLAQAEKASVNVQLEQRRSTSSMLKQGCDAFKGLFTLDHLKGGAERMLFVIILWAIFTGWFVAFFYIGLSVRDKYGYMVLPEKQIGFNPDTDMPGPLPWMVATS